MTKSRVKSLILLHLLFFIYSLTSVLSKFAGTFEFLSFNFIICYSGSLLLLFVYAVFWQQILKTIPLSVAFANKGIVLLWGMLFGQLFWNEGITFIKICAAGIVLIGIYLVVTSDE